MVTYVLVCVTHMQGLELTAYLPHPPLPPFGLLTSLLILICTGTLLVSLSCSSLAESISSHEITFQAEIWALSLALP